MITSYQLVNFGTVFECLSDFQAVYLDSKQQLIGSTKTFLILLVNYLILEAFMEPKKKIRSLSESDQSAIDCRINEGAQNTDDMKSYDEYRPY
jgi:hypothetical protein